jgi:putative heme-binding domain-containing protein
MRALCLLLAALPLAAQNNRNPFGSQPDAIAKGKETYLGACSACHGVSGMGGQGPNLVTGRQVARLSDPEMFRSIKGGVKGTDMPPFPMPDEKVWQLVSFVRSLGAPAIRASLPGDAALGRTLFFGKAGCSKCHAIAGDGGVLGPDLTNAGAARTANLLREAILEPNARIVNGFEAVTVLTAGGQEVKGVARNQDNYSIQLVDLSGRLRLFAAQEVKQVRPAEGSLMPAGYEQKLRKDEVDGLLAFLARQAVRPEESK